jgi:hypothetical protein
MSDRRKTALTIVAIIAAVIGLIFAAALFENYRAEVWARALERHGIDGAVLPGGVR